ncbi:IS21 family transposase [Gemmatimonas sp.]|uniref:IS21 family transposase n=1 Tax=Gemmatimonas sp. TaxID=1962908 RepID=UPI0039833C11
MNVLKAHLRITITTLLARGASQHEIAQRTGVDRKTIRRYARAAAANAPMVATGSAAMAGEMPPPRPPGDDGIVAAAVVPHRVHPGPATSACEPHRSWIEAQVALGRNAVSVFQDLVDQRGFTHQYNSVKRFVAALKARAPERFDVLEFLPGEEAQVDYGQGAPTRTASGKYQRPILFVMTLKYSGKCFRKVVWKTSQVVWAQLHEEAFRSFGGCCRYVVLDNLREGVVRPDWYEPGLNPVYAAVLAHHGVVADPCRVRDPNRKGTVEAAIQHTQTTALKGRTFETLEAQNAWLVEWEARWASPRIHGRKKRQVSELYREEQPHLLPLPREGFRYFTQGVRTVDDAGLVQIEGAYYAAGEAALASVVTVRVYAQAIEILDRRGVLLRRHQKALRKGAFVMAASDRLFNPSRETARVLARAAQIGPQTAALAQVLFARVGRPGQRALQGLASLPRTYARTDIEAVCARLLAADCISYTAIKSALARRAEEARAAADAAPLTQSGPGIRAPLEYQTFWDQHAADEASRTPVGASA